MEKSMTLQEIYSKVRTHLLTQRKPAIDVGGTCCYRTGSGLKCAVGCLIPDNRYSHRLEGQTLDLDPTGEITYLIAGLYGWEAIPLLKMLQIMHDCNPVSSWETGLNEIAARFKLEPR